MNSRQLVAEEINKYGINELFFASSLYKEKFAGTLTEAAYFKTLGRMCNSGQLLNIARGVYCRPEITNYGILGPSDKSIVRTFTENGTGTVVGYTLFNQLGLTTQIAKCVDVFSSNIMQDIKTIQNVHICRYRLDYSDDVTEMIRLLEVVKHFEKIQDMNYAGFVRYVRTAAGNYRQDVFEYVTAEIKYQKRTVAFLKEILDYYGVPNGLDKHLSTLTRYVYPKMEEINELAQV